jgi:hypothetical protein
MNITEKLKQEQTIKISGVMLMYIANVLRDRHLALLSALNAVLMGEDDDKADELGDAAMANEIVGQRIMDCIEDIIGKDDFKKFIEGKLDLASPEFMRSNGTVN